jgi:hypothetical protein
MVSSPDIDSSRSDIAAWSVRPPSRASDMIASCRQQAGDRSLARTLRPHNEEDLLLPGICREAIAEPILQGFDRLAVFAENIMEKGIPMARLRRVIIELNIGSAETEVIGAGFA